jgi:hypothetical protein
MGVLLAAMCHAGCEGSVQGGEGIVTDLVDKIVAAAEAAIRDVAPTIEAAGPRLGLLTIELELDTKGRVVGGVAWPQLRINTNKVLGVGRG